MNSRRFIYIVLLLVLIGICLPENVPVKFNVNKSKINFVINPISINTSILGMQIKKEFKTKLGLDLKGGSHLVFKVDTKGVKAEDVKDALESARDIIEKRVNFFGVSEPLVQNLKSGNEQRITVDLPGLENVSQAVTLIGQTAQLRFVEEGPLDPKIASTASLLDRLNKDTGMNGKHVKKAAVVFNPDDGKPQVSLTFTGEGAKLFEEVTGRNIGKPVGIFLDYFPISAPTVQQKIIDGSAVITGSFTTDEAKKPWPADPTAPSASRTNGPSQVYLYDANTQATALISAATDGATPADSESAEAWIALDGRGVMFTSRASNLAPGANTAVSRLYWWDRASASLRVLAELGDASPTGRLAMSPNGEWIGWLPAASGGLPTLYLYNTTEGAGGYLSLTPTVEQSATGPGWVGVQPAGVSADGRYIALTATPTEPAGGTNHMQVYLVDTQTGTRQLVSQGVDGNLANGHPTPPSLSADGSQVLFVSGATNLVADDANRVTDAFFHTVANGQRRMLRRSPIPANAPALSDCLLSPEGGVAYLRFTESTTTKSRFARTSNGTLSAAFAGTIIGSPSFSGGGSRVAVNRSPTTSPTTAVIEIHDPAAWLASAPSASPALWASTTPAREPVLSADGRRVAFLITTTTPLGSNTVVVADWAANQTVFSMLVSRTTLSMPALSEDGRFLTWLSPGAAAGSGNQVWRADVDNGTVALVSVGPDGSSEANGNSKFVALSADGRYVAFASLADNLVPGDTNGAKDVFLRDMVTGQTLLVSRTPEGAPGAGWSLQPFFSADGRSLFFLSYAPDLAPGDYNQAVDLFKVEIVGDSGLLLVIQRNLTTGQAQLLWNGAADKTYAVEFKDDLAAGWTRVPGEFTGDAPVDVNPAASERRFFRVVELP